jgi:hypothetical protein
MKTISCSIFTLLFLASSSSGGNGVVAATTPGEAANKNRLLDGVCFPTVSQFSKANMLISGWYDNCNDIPVIVEVNGTEMEDTRTCSSSVLQSFGGVPLDGTGTTCYVNPIFSTPLDVFWLGPHVDPTTLKKTEQMAIYYIGFSTRFNDTGNSRDLYMPKDCDDNGVCTCSSVEPIRTDWGKEELDTRHWCDELEIPGLTSCGSNILEESVRVDESASEHCLLLGEKFNFAADNVTKQMFCDVNLQVSFLPDGLCVASTITPSSAYTRMVSLLPVATVLIGMTFAAIF